MIAVNNTPRKTGMGIWQLYCEGVLIHKELTGSIFENINSYLYINNLQIFSNFNLVMCKALNPS